MNTTLTYHVVNRFFRIHTKDTHGSQFPVLFQFLNVKHYVCLSRCVDQWCQPVFKIDPFSKYHFKIPGSKLFLMLVGRSLETPCVDVIVRSCVNLSDNIPVMMILIAANVINLLELITHRSLFFCLHK